MASITLDFIKEEIDRRYAPFVVEGVAGGDVTLLPLLSLKSEHRKELLGMLDRVNKLQESSNDENTAKASSEEVSEMLDIFGRAVSLVAENDAAAERLHKALNYDTAAYTLVFTEYIEATQVGEAEPSED